MAAPDPGFAVMPLAEDPQKGGIEEKSQDSSDELPIAPDQFDPQFQTSRWEIWAYYSYYIGNNGLTLFNFAPTAFQNLLSQAAGDAGTLRFAGIDRTINSIVLVANGISFAIQIVLFLVIGSYAGNCAQQVQMSSWTDNGKTSDARDLIFLLCSRLSPSALASAGWACIHQTNGRWRRGCTSWAVGSYSAILAFQC